MSKHNPFVLYTEGNLYQNDLIGDTPNDFYNRKVYRVVGMYRTVDQALDILNTVNQEDNDESKQFTWFIKSESEFKKLMNI